MYEMLMGMTEAVLEEKQQELSEIISQVKRMESDAEK